MSDSTKDPTSTQTQPRPPQNGHPPPNSNTPDAATIRARLQCDNSRCECHRPNGKLHCPAHQDSKPSLKVDTGPGGKLLYHCHGGCTQQAVTEALKNLNGYRPAPAATRPAARTKATPAQQSGTVTTYDYPDESGALLFQVLRKDFINDHGEPDKKIWQRQPNGKGWINNLDGVRRVPYNLLAVIAAEVVYICEGEKAADALNAALQESGRYGREVATTNPHGAGKWLDEYSPWFKDKTVIVLPDNDKPGADHAETVCRSLLGVAATVKRVELPGLPPKGDIADWLQDGHTLPELDTLIEAAPAIEKPRQFPVLSLKEILSRPRLKYLVQDILLELGTSVFTADYGAFKSFNVLDIGLCVATGKEWHGRKVKQGTVVYVIAEGAYTSADRVQAWMIRHHFEEPPENFHTIETAVQIADGLQRAQLVEELQEFSPVLVIFDTLAKCNLGRDENASDAMGLFTHGMEQIGRELGAHVMAIHHNNKAGNARGSNSLPANVDTHIVLEKSAGRVVTFKCDKQKGAPFEPFALIGRVVELPHVDEYGRQVTSLVFESTDTPATPEPTSKADATRERILKVLRTHADFKGKAKRGALWAECEKLNFVSKSGFYNHLTVLEKTGFIEVDGWGFLCLSNSSNSSNLDNLEAENQSSLSRESLDSGQTGHSDESDREEF